MQAVHMICALIIAILYITTTRATPNPQHLPNDPSEPTPKSNPHCYDPPIPIPGPAGRSHFKPFTPSDCQPLLSGLKAYQYYHLVHEWQYPKTDHHKIPEGFAWYYKPCIIYLQTEPGERASFSLETVVNATDGIFGACTLPRLPGVGGFAELPGELFVWSVVVLALSDDDGEGDGRGWDQARALSEVRRYGRELGHGREGAGGVVMD